MYYNVRTKQHGKLSFWKPNSNISYTNEHMGLSQGKDIINKKYDLNVDKFLFYYGL